MGNVVILDENTINKIAAGEVVDKPASIVKELVENSIDANSTKITVEIVKGGIQKIKITDDGMGIASDDVEIAFERHATSKIRKEEDIQNIKSMGFRGEALASVAAIAKVTLETKKKEESTGTKIVINTGAVESKEEIPWDKGTSITVENVFANVPARYKFLKKDFTEAGYIEDNITRLALANPQIAFKYINNGKVIFATSGNGDINTAVFNVFGKQTMENVFAVVYKYENIEVVGVIGTPNISRSTRQNEFLFVNSRYVKDKILMTALEKAYDQSLNIGKFPFAILNIIVPPQELDVNVHPAKLEIKFENESKIFEAVYHAVKNAIEIYHRKISPFANEENRELINIPSMEILKVEDEKKEILEINEEKNIAIMEDRSIVQKTEPVAITMKKEEFKPTYYDKESALEIKDIPVNMVEENLQVYDTKVKYKYIGSLFDTYILIEIGEKLYIIDQHAAHERLLYEQIKKVYYTKQKETQMLMIPTLVELKYKEREIVNNNLQMFQDVGYIIEDFGDNAIKISGVPNIGFDISYEEMFKDIVDELMENVKTTREEKETRFVYTMACKAAVKANMKLTKEEHIALLDKMMELDNPFTCPHGRPTAYEITKYEIERRFARK